MAGVCEFWSLRVLDDRGLLDRMSEQLVSEVALVRD